MGYRIEQEGFEFRGVKLGQKCIVDGEETIIIGFDKDDDYRFILVKDNGDYGSRVDSSDCITTLLEGHEDSLYEWRNLDDIELIESSIDEENLPQSISPIHVADILEDVLKMDMYEEPDTIAQIIRDCITSLRA